jgi:hypothetical protein
LSLRENLATDSRLTWKATSTGWTGTRNLNTRTRPGAGGGGGRASYVLPHLWLLLALFIRATWYEHFHIFNSQNRPGWIIIHVGTFYLWESGLLNDHIY